MGVITRIEKLADGKYMKPVIYIARNYSSETKQISMNRPLAERLIKLTSPRQRGMRMRKVLLDCLKDQPDDVVITDIDAMFNPDYPIDVLQVLIDTCRVKAFQVLWPGSYESGALVYSVPDRSDYKKYSIENYDVTVII